MKTLLIGSMLLGLGISAAAPADAFHGAFYIARGSATLPAGLGDYDAILRWSGSLFGELGTMTVELYDADTGALAHKNTVSSNEDTRNVGFEGCVEFVNPYHLTAIAGPALLDLDGIMRNDLCTFTATDDFAGSYLTVFALDVHVRGFEHG